MAIHKISSSQVHGEIKESEERSPPQSDVSTSSEDEEDDDQNWDDWVSDSEARPCKSLFDTTELPSVKAVLEYDSKVHGFNLDAVCKKLGLDFYGRIRLVNYIRTEKSRPGELASLTGNEEIFTSDDFLKPVVEDDPLLHTTSDNWSDDEETENTNAGPSSYTNPQQQIRILEKKLVQAQRDLADYRKLVETRFGLSQLAKELSTQVDEPNAIQSGAGRDDDTHYFRSYGEHEIHAVMIQDRVRTATYASFIFSSTSLFEGATVLDVGCGTGILSLFAAKSGAKRVLAVDASDISKKAREIVKANGYDDIITVISGKVEEITLPEGIEKVDVIISEWMGYALLYESMLDSVLYARDAFLRPGGVMAPSQCRMMLGLGSVPELYKERVAFWSDVYGFDLSVMAEEVYEDAIVDVAGPETIVSNVAIIKDLYLQKITPRQLDFSNSFELKSTNAQRTTVHAFVLYFDTFFSPSGSAVTESESVRVVNEGDALLAEVWRVGSHSGSQSHAALIRRRSSRHASAGHRVDDASAGEEVQKEKITSFSTGPQSVPTHWKQTVFLLREPLTVQEGTTVSGVIRCYKSPENTRELDVEIQYEVKQPDGQKSSEVVIQTFKVR